MTFQTKADRACGSGDYTRWCALWLLIQHWQRSTVIQVHGLMTVWLACLTLNQSWRCTFGSSCRCCLHYHSSSPIPLSPDSNRCTQTFTDFFFCPSGCNSSLCFCVFTCAAVAWHGTPPSPQFPQIDHISRNLGCLLPQSGTASRLMQDPPPPPRRPPHPFVTTPSQL